MIFGVGLFIFAAALFVTWCRLPEPAGYVLSLLGVTGLLAMLVSVCIWVARFMP